MLEPVGQSPKWQPVLADAEFEEIIDDFRQAA
jgi:hypothetical protein